MTLKDLSLYIHWPFCKSKCPYCDFNSHVRAQINEQQWEEAFLYELDRTRQQTGARQLNSIFFGGGTPSLMPPALVKKLIDRARSLWFPSQSLEITLEANPNSVEINRFEALAEAGVNRVSLGIQSLDEAALKFLGRQHSVSEAKQAILTAQAAFSRVSFDLIYALPQQTLGQWENQLKEALDFGTDHLSLYQLTIEPGTAFAPLHARGAFNLPEDDLAADLYYLTTDVTAAVGLNAYEVSNYARKGFECRHNLVYWQYGDYAGVGPGAHGRLSCSSQKNATRQYKAPETWLNKVLNYETGQEDCLKLSQKEECVEALMMGLRLFQPLSLAALPLKATEILDIEAIFSLQNHGLIVYDRETLEITKAGMIVLNSILKKIIKPL